MKTFRFITSWVDGLKTVSFTCNPIAVSNSGKFLIKNVRYCVTPILDKFEKQVDIEAELFRTSNEQEQQDIIGHQSFPKN